MLGVVLSVVSAVLFGGMSIALGFAMRRSTDAEAGAFVTAFAGFVVCAAVAAVGRAWGGDLGPFLLAGCRRSGAGRRRRACASGGARAAGHVPSDRAGLRARVHRVLRHPRQRRP